MIVKIRELTCKQNIYDNIEATTDLGNTFQHILDVRANCANGSKFLLSAEPLLNTKTAFLGHVHVDCEVFERPLEDTARTGNGHNTVLDRGREPLGDLHLLFA